MLEKAKTGLPAPAGHLTFKINGVTRTIAYYADSPRPPTAACPGCCSCLQRR